jgi:hypothetical protein
MKKTDFEGLLAGLGDALAYAKGNADIRSRAHFVEIDRTFARRRSQAGLAERPEGDTQNKWQRE